MLEVSHQNLGNGNEQIYSWNKQINDQNLIKRNLIDNEESNDKENNAELNSSSILIPALSTDKSFEMASIVDGTNKQEPILYSKSSKISLLSDDISHRYISGMNRLSSLYIYLFKDQFQPIKKISDISSLIGEEQLLDSLESSETLEEFNEHSDSSLQSKNTIDTIRK